MNKFKEVDGSFFDTIQNLTLRLFFKVWFDRITQDRIIINQFDKHNVFFRDQYEYQHNRDIIEIKAREKEFMYMLSLIRELNQPQAPLQGMITHYE